MLVWKVTDVDVVKLLVNIELSDKFLSGEIEFEKLRKIHFIRNCNFTCGFIFFKKHRWELGSTNS